MLYLDPWFYAFLLLSALVLRLLTQRVGPTLLLAAGAGWLGWQAPHTLAAIAGAGLLGWLVCAFIWSRPKGDQRARLVANLASALMVAGIVVARLTTDLFGGLRVSEAEMVNDAVLLLGIAYLALKLHHSFRFALYDPAQKLGLLSYLHYMIYLPTLIAGPILRIAEWKALQTATGRPTEADVAIGLRRIAWGLFKKVVIGGVLFSLAMRVQGMGTVGLIASLPIWTLFVYADFGALADIAVGASRLYGWKIRENFDAPFSATSLSHFWRRWHITMGDWLREHIFVPLGGMRASRMKAAGIMFATMVFCGLWHAIELRFLLWGVYHGLLLFGEGLLGVKPLPPQSPLWKLLWRRLVVFLLLSVGVIFFLMDLWA